VHHACGSGGHPQRGSWAKGPREAGEHHVVDGCPGLVLDPFPQLGAEPRPSQYHAIRQANGPLRRGPRVSDLGLNPPPYKYTCTVVGRTFPEPGGCASIWDIGNPTIFSPSFSSFFWDVRLFGVSLRPARGVLQYGTCTYSGHIPLTRGG